MIAVNREICLG